MRATFTSPAPRLAVGGFSRPRQTKHVIQVLLTPSPSSDVPTSPFDISVASAPADQWVPLSSHPCLTLTSGVLTGPGPSLQVRLAAHLSPVLRPDPPPGRLRRHFPLTLIGDASSTSFPRRAPRASPVGTSSFVPCRR